jgi:putative tryptophan/tyrosine transport system substrate-binding protein
MNRRRLLGAFAAGPLLAAGLAQPQPASKMHRVGFFFAGWSESAEREEHRQKNRKIREELLRALARYGYELGRNLTVHWRFFDMDFSRAPGMARELVALGVDVLHTVGTPQTKALQDGTKTIPIVTNVGEPVTSGFTTSLARPSGNITGLAASHPDSPAKQVEFLRAIVPKLDRVAVIGDARYGAQRELLAPWVTAARAAGLRPEVVLATPIELADVFVRLKRDGVRAAYLMYPGNAGTPAIEPAIRHGIATMFVYSDYVEHGALIGLDMLHANREERHMVMIDKLLRGAKIADIPWELPDRSHLAINLRTARALGLEVPNDLLLRADQVIQ